MLPSIIFLFQNGTGTELIIRATKRKARLCLSLLYSTIQHYLTSTFHLLFPPFSLPASSPPSLHRLNPLHPSVSTACQNFAREYLRFFCRLIKEIASNRRKREWSERGIKGTSIFKKITIVSTISKYSQLRIIVLIFYEGWNTEEKEKKREGEKKESVRKEKMDNNRRDTFEAKMIRGGSGGGCALGVSRVIKYKVRSFVRSVANNMLSDQW